MDATALEVLKSMSVLYVEDDLATREELALILAPWVGELHVASDGQAGLELFRLKRPDMVVTDIQMPRLSGLAMAAEIRNLAPEQVIIVISAYNDVEYLFRAIELGIDQYVTKPVNVERLLLKLAQTGSAIVAHKALQRNQVLLQQYKELVDESAAVCRMDATGVIIYANDQMCSMSGLARSELLGRSFSNLMSVDKNGGSVDAILALAGAGSKWSGLLFGRTRNDALYVMESSLVPICSEAGLVLEIIAMNVDISGLYRQYETLLDEINRSQFSMDEQRHILGEYKYALEQGNCICVIDHNYCISSLNAPFERLLGHSSADLSGKPLITVAPGMTVDFCVTSAVETAQGNFAHRTVRFQPKAGEEVQLSVGCVEVRNLAGVLESTIVICQDITDSLRMSHEVVETQRELLYTMGGVMDSRNAETGHHVRRVSMVSRFLAIKIGLPPEMADMIEIAAPMHDIGKVGIRDVVLQKNDRLSPDEFEEMKEHANIGHIILGKVERPLIRIAATIAHEHHERYDGTGYPDGLQGEAIHIAARIVAVADVLDALLSARAYKLAWTPQRVQEYFQEQRGRQFDPALVDLLLAHWDTIQALRSSGEVH